MCFQFMMSPSAAMVVINNSLECNLSRVWLGRPRRLCAGVSSITGAQRPVGDVCSSDKQVSISEAAVHDSGV